MSSQGTHYRPELPRGAQQIPLRVDFVLANEHLLRYSNVSARVQREDSKISDHFPLVAGWDAAPLGGGEGQAQTDLSQTDHVSSLSFFEAGPWRRKRR